MKYLKHILFIFILNIPMCVLAYGVQLSCPSSIKAGDEFKCTIYSPSSCSEISMTLELPEGYTLKSEKAGKNFKFVGNGNNLSYTVNGSIDRIITVLTIKSPSNASSKALISLKNLKYKYQDNDSQYTVSTDISEIINVQANKSSTTTSSSTTTTTKTTENFILTLDSNVEGGENQSLSCTPANGTCDVVLTNVNIPTKKGYTFNGWGSTKECISGETEKYTLNNNVTLYACFKNILNHIAHLKSLEITGYDISFNSDNLNYSLNVNEDVNNLSINAIPYNSEAKLEIISPDTLKTGENTIQIRVTEDEEAVTYTILVHKYGDIVPLLSNLVIQNHKIDFAPTKYTYNLKIDHNVTALEILPTVDDGNISINIIGNENLTDNSTISIVLTSANGQSTTYNINVSYNTIFDEYSTYIIGGIIIIFMFTVYFIVRHIKKQRGEIKSNKPPKVKREKKSKKDKKNKIDNNIPETISNAQNETIETLETL